eukprot:m.171267 g.171267  ORF g.171267 m.171267 type:complete len:432 (+) comp13496_c0_seq2:1031-2326(+)
MVSTRQVTPKSEQSTTWNLQRLCLTHMFFLTTKSKCKEQVVWLFGMLVGLFVLSAPSSCFIAVCVTKPVWLGRLDEVEFVMYNDVVYSKRKRQFIIPTTLKGLQVGGVDVLRIPLSDFSGRDITAVETMKTSRPFHILPNSPSLQILLYKVHSPVGGRRTAILCPIQSMTDVPKRLCLACFAQRASYGVLFVTTDANIWQWFTTLGLNVLLHSVKGANGNALAATVDVGVKAVHLFYSFAIVDAHVLLTSPLEQLVGNNYAKNSADDVVVFSFSSTDSTSRGHLILTRPSPDTYTMWSNLYGKLAVDDTIISIVSTVHNVKHQHVLVREEHVVAHNGGACAVDRLEKGERLHLMLDKLYMSTLGHPLDGHVMLEMQSEVNMDRVCSLFKNEEEEENSVGDDDMNKSALRSGDSKLFEESPQRLGAAVLCRW